MPFTCLKKKNARMWMLDTICATCATVKFSSPKALPWKESTCKHFIYLQHANCHETLLDIWLTGSKIALYLGPEFWAHLNPITKLRNNTDHHLFSKLWPKWSTAGLEIWSFITVANGEHVFFFCILPFNHKSFCEDHEKDGDNFLELSGKTLTNSNQFTKRQLRNSTSLPTHLCVEYMPNPPLYLSFLYLLTWERDRKFECVHIRQGFGTMICPQLQPAQIMGTHRSGTLRKSPDQNWQPPPWAWWHVWPLHHQPASSILF